MIKLPQLAGYLFALASVFLWVLVAIFYKDVGTKVSPFRMNIGKSLIAALCIGILLCIKGFESVNNQGYSFLWSAGS